MLAGELIWKVTGDTRQFDKATKETETKAKGLGDKLTGIGKLASAAFGVAAVAGVTNISKSLIKAASDAEETRNKFNVTFKDVAEQAKSSADVLSSSYGVSQQAAERLLSTTGDLLSGFGFKGQAALDLSTKVNKLAIDLGSFQNVSSERASEALTKALLGETESAKSLGIVIRQDTKEFKDNVKALQEREGLTLQQAKAQVIFSQAVTQSKNAIGDFARSQDSFANQSKIASAAVEDIKTSLGNSLLPIATDLINIFNDSLVPIIKTAIDALTGLDETTQKVIIAGSALIPVVIGVASALPAIVTGFAALQAVLLGPVGIIVGVVALTAGLVALGVEENKRAKAIASAPSDLQRYNAELKNSADRIDGVKSSLSSLRETVDKEGYTELFGNKIFGETFQKAVEDSYKELENLNKTLGITTGNTQDISTATQGYVIDLNRESQVTKLTAEQYEEYVKQREKVLKNIKELEKIAAGAKSSDAIKKENTSIKENTALLEKREEVKKELGIILDQIGEKESLLGDRYDDNAAKIDAYNSAIDELIALGVKGNDPVLKGFLDAIELLEPKDATENPWEKRLDDASDFFDKVGELASGFGALQRSIADNRIADIDRQLEKDIEAIEQSSLAEEEKTERIKQLNKEANKQKAQEEYKVALWQWGANLSGAIASTAKGIAEALPNIPLSIIAGVIGASQIAAVTVAKPKPPQLATGGIVMPTAGGVPTVMAENGAPELALNGGAEGEQLLDEFGRRVAKAGGGVMAKINIIMDNIVTKSGIYDLSRNREIFFSAEGIV